MRSARARASTRGRPDLPLTLARTWLAPFLAELKARFDNGDDPNDSSNQGGGGGGHHHGNPFAHHGGNPFGGGGQFFQQGGFKQSHQEFKFTWG